MSRSAVARPARRAAARPAAAGRRGTSAAPRPRSRTPRGSRRIRRGRATAESVSCRRSTACASVGPAVEVPELTRQPSPSARRRHASSTCIARRRPRTRRRSRCRCRSHSRLSGRIHTPCRSSASPRVTADVAQRERARARRVGRRGSLPSPTDRSTGCAGTTRPRSCAAWRASSAGLDEPVPTVVGRRAPRPPPSARARPASFPPATPNSSPSRTSTRPGSTGGWVPSSVLATSDRAVSGRSAQRWHYEIATSDPFTVILSAWPRRWCRSLSSLPDVLPTDRLQAVGHARARGAGRAASHLERPERGHRRRVPAADLRRRRRRDVDRAVVGVPLRVRLDGPRALPAEHPRPRGRAPPLVHVALAERRRRASGCSRTRRSRRSRRTGACTSRTTRTRWVPTSPTSRCTRAIRSRPTRCAASSRATCSSCRARRT